MGFVIAGFFIVWFIVVGFSSGVRCRGVRCSGVRNARRTLQNLPSENFVPGRIPRQNSLVCGQFSSGILPFVAGRRISNTFDNFCRSRPISDSVRCAPALCRQTRAASTCAAREFCRGNRPGTNFSVGKFCSVRRAYGETKQSMNLYSVHKSYTCQGCPTNLHHVELRTTVSVYRYLLFSSHISNFNKCETIAWGTIISTDMECCSSGIQKFSEELR